MPANAITYSDAIDTLFGIVNAAWAGALSIVGYTPEIRWQGREVPNKPPINKIWARVSSQIVTDTQASLADKNSKRIYHAKGLLYIQLFCPRTDDLTIPRLFAQYIREAFRSESSDGNIWFTNPRIVEQPPTKAHYPIVVSTNFEYDNINGQVNIGSLVPAMIARGKHFPVEAIDGIRTAFTFIGIPNDSLVYIIVFNGIIYEGLPKSGEQITFPIAPNPNNIPSDFIYAIW
jgi:hypothetical protein